MSASLKFNRRTFLRTGAAAAGPRALNPPSR